MMKLTVPKNYNGKMFYVSSEANPNSKEDSHIVVRSTFERLIGGNIDVFFCDCRNFFVERLPKLGTPGFSLCKHGEFVQEVLGLIPAGYANDIESLEATSHR